MISQLRWGFLILAFAPACGLFGDEPQTDGQVCSVDDDCSTSVCTNANLCSHSRCTCPSGNCPVKGGEQTSDCLDGWLCVKYDSIFDPAKEFFGGKANPSDGYCQPSCAAGCPEHYLCDGDLCVADQSWAAPQLTVTWTGPVSGELEGRGQSTTVAVEEGSTLNLTGSAVSPTGEQIISQTWTTVSAAGDLVQFEGEAIETTVPLGQANYRRVEFSVIDARARTSYLTVIFEGCIGAGGTCGYSGSGCCNGCDGVDNVCL